MSALGAILLLALLALIVGIVYMLASSGPTFRWANRTGRNCPGCGGFRVTTVVSDDRLNGYLECRACHRVWDPAAHRGR
ncbi:hypothetical protein ACFQ0X_42280 [Streptomyces rectiviolaceus]|uniref:Uncharacterized protein n=1 Tax=Streptomyces rectiviolaceus TaxID=332591 RepID=A0ABP6MHI9_9ACTN